MAKVLIRHCALRLVRHGGWSWGAEPRELARRALAALPGLLAKALAELIPAERVLVVTQPVKLTLSVSLADLLEGRLQSQRASRPAEALAMALKAALRQALEQAVGRPLAQALQPDPSKTGTAGVAMPSPVEARDGNAAPLASATRATEPMADPAPDALLFRLLAAWGEQKRLVRRLRALPEPLLRRWHLLLLEGPAKGNPQCADQTIAEMEAIARDIGVPLTAGAPERPEDRLAGRLAVAVTAALRLGLAPVTAAARAALDRILPVSAKNPAPVADEPVRTAPPEPAATRALAAAAIHPGETWEAQIECVLPFLILGPLVKMGWLDLLAASFERPQQALAPLAAALANKTLAEPRNGWRREPDASRDAAVFAGCREPVPEHELVQFAATAADLCAGAEASLAQAVLAGRDVAKPLILLASSQPSGLLLLDPDGLFPAVFGADIDALAAWLPDDGLLWLAGDTSALAAPLAAAGLRWLAPQPPAGAVARTVFDRGRRCFTNDPDAPDGRLLAQARAMAARDDELDELLAMLVQGRRAVVNAGDDRLERGLTAAAGCGLATLAWTLWREREAVSPQLALLRFGDLGAAVRFERDAVRVRLPLGRRFQDLDRAGLLADVPRVPWFAGRTLVFSGG